ncbi:MAG: hypothetical protein HY293_14205 [Planctomycetes bacterium]|nr:hypothetical protein [Planctomycetota bacterium]
MTYVFRDRRINEASLWTPGGSTLRDADSFILPDLALRLDLESPAGAAAIEIGNLPLHFRNSDPRLQQDRLGESTALNFDLLQAWIEPRAGVRLGVQDFAWDPLGRGHPLLLAPSRAESPWGEEPDSTVPPFPASGTNTVPQTRRDRPRPVGVTARIDDLGLTIFALAIGEGGSVRFDESLTGGIYETAIGDLRLSGVFAFLAADSLFRDHDRQISTGGLAASYGSGPFSVGAEGYLQRGDAGARIRAEGNAFRLIARYAGGIRLQATATRISGDRRGDDRREGRFLSYEDNDATLIVEGNEFGLDIDSNYETLQVSLGLPLKPVELQLMAAWFRFLQAVPLPPDPPPGVGGRSRALGAEIDATIDAPLNRQVALTAGAAWLLGSAALENFTQARETQAWLLTAGFRLRF